MAATGPREGMQRGQVGADRAGADGGQDVAAVDGPEQPPAVRPGRQVAGVVTNEWAEGQHVDDQQRDTCQEQAGGRRGQGRLAGGKRAVPHALDEHDDQRGSHHDGGGLHHPVDPPVPEDPDHQRRDDQDQDPLRDSQRPGYPVHGLSLDDQLRRDETDVQQQHGREHERRPVEAELPPALDRLRHPEPGTLGRVQRDKQRPDDRPGGDSDQRPPEGQPDRDDHGTEDDVEHVDVAAPPERELVPRLPVPGPGRNHVNVAVLDVPAQLIVPRCGYSHICSPFPEGSLLVL